MSETDDDLRDPAPDDEPVAVPMLREPVDGVPEPLTTPGQLAEAIAGLRAARGPVAVDAERASGYRYSQRAYLVQLRRAGYPTVLVDPIALPDLHELGSALESAEWIVHAAHQDLPCLSELGLAPRRLFDTELAGRLLGQERVALGTMVERYLGIGLEKGHSAADWSVRPLPHDWLVYAALDVELLVELRDVLADELAKVGKSDWAEQEFEAVRRLPPLAPRAEPWRRTSGIHATRNRRQLAAVRALWEARDSFAAARDVAPGRVLPDSAIIEAARRNPRTQDELLALPIFGGSRQRRVADRWFGALARAQALPDNELPTITGPALDSTLPPGRWRDRAPDAAARLASAREVIAQLADKHEILTQNLLASDVLRRICWTPPEPLTTDTVRARLAELGARPWQIELTAEALCRSLAVTAESAPADAGAASDEPGDNRPGG
ncbi:MAG: ribonuclease D [Actinobacteria bacterium]|nr:ribonuclease D [Actinomycetota bacterium]